MPDETTPTPVEQPTTPPQQDSKQAPDGYIEIARYNGLIRKVEQLTLENRELKTSLEAKTSDLERTSSQLGIKDAEKDIAVRERDTQLQGLVQEKSALERRVNDLEAYKLKVDTVLKMNKPALLKIIDKIPSMTDPEALETVLKDFASFADEAAAERERQLTAGVVQPVGQGAKTSTAPASEKDWKTLIDGLPLGSPERQKAFDGYWEYLSSQNK